MKTGFDEEKTAPRGSIGALVVVFVLCLGLGVTGTLLWAGNRPKSPVVAASGATSGANSVAIPASPNLEEIVGVSNLRVPLKTENHLPPASLTAGMSPRQASLTLANWFYDHHKHESAVKSFRRAIDLGVTHPNVRTDLGNALRMNGQPKEALKQYQIAQQQDPTHEPSLFNQGALYATALKNRPKAVEVWSLYLKRFPKGTQTAQARQLLAKFGGK